MVGSEHRFMNLCYVVNNSERKISEEKFVKQYSWTYHSWTQLQVNKERKNSKTGLDIWYAALVWQLYII